MNLPCTTLILALLVVVPAGASSAQSTQAKPDADLCAVPPGAQPSLPARLLDGMGDTNMPVTTTSPEAQKFFNQGVSQVHSFWFIEAERSFLQAAKLDPGMAMAHWGIALSAAGDYRPAFQLLRGPNEGREARAAAPEQASDAVQRDTNGAAISPQVRAREAIAKALSLRDKVSDRERLYIESQAARREAGKSAKERDGAYIAGLRKLVAAYPDDLEAKSMLGLALLDGFESISKTPRTNTLEGLRLLEEVVAKNDNAFGAHHYLIHGYEGSHFPYKAWWACRRYPELVPNIPHALHMPGHIYAQSDMIDEAADAFAAAARNELKWLAADALYPNGHHGHNVHFWIHSLNLDGRFKDSMEQVRHLLGFKETPRERRAADNQRVTYRQGYYALVKTLVRFEKWDLILDGQTLPVYGQPAQQVWRLWAMGLAHAGKGNLDKAQAMLADIKTQFKAIEAQPSGRVTDPLQIAALELEATIGARGDDRKKGYELFQKAVDREIGLLYTEPPAYPRPVVEGYANTALALGDYAVAEKAYRGALAQEWGSGRAYFGLAAALAGQNKAADSRVMLEKAARAWSKADADLPQMQRARQPTAAAQ